ncbi:acyl-CoA thioesterase [Mycobacterium parmense]|uniref:Acyl-CoA thioesterase II n=1 Tax=Mycobacterium parmense TaxID=185642 RepID=A0A7I7Z1F1_9MYCO|nr:acyl-CoA thioesterase domain-containing protein [Mycobacterium parmense]MCV7352380.1 thioesterase family protein [Mycobacterium parmense]BBZ47896.1 acyl-CoA thioesterase II [Mycobacterium parmense]
MNLDQFRAMLTLSDDREGRTVLPVPDASVERIFGGQIMAQLIAAAAPPGSAKAVKSLHIAFPRAGRAAEPLYLDLERTYDGRSLGHRRAVAWQGQEVDRRVVATASILVDRADDGYDYQYSAAAAGDPMAAKPIDFAVIPGEARLIGEGLDVDEAKAADLGFWMRCPDFTDTALAQPVIAYVSDWPLIGTLLKALPGVSQRDAHVSVQTGVVTHSVWFHHPFDVSEWLRVQIHGVRLVGGRGFGTGEVYTRSGSHVASFAQESVIRTPPKGMQP